MNSPWSSSTEGRDWSPPAEAASDARPEGSPHEIGPTSGLLHDRLNSMADRLGDLKSLSDEFDLLASPLTELTIELTKTNARVAEAESLLEHKTSENLQLRRELTDLRDRHSVLLNDTRNRLTIAQSPQETVDLGDLVSAEDKRAISELRRSLEISERDVAYDKGRRERLEAEIAGLFKNLAEKTKALENSEGLVGKLKKDRTASGKNITRLENLAREQISAISDLQTRVVDWERFAKARLEECLSLQGKLEAERRSRQQSDDAHDTALTALRAERSSLGAEIAALGSRLASADEAILRAGEQLAERGLALYRSDEVLRELEIQRAALDEEAADLRRRCAGYSDQLSESRRLADGLAKRCETLASELSGKETALAAALELARNSSDKVDELTKRFEHDRLCFEAAHRRVLEDLENEKAERSLAQGALTIARESRLSLQRINESLKRSNRAMRTSSFSDAEASGNEEAGSDLSSDTYLRTGKESSDVEP